MSDIERNDPYSGMAILGEYDFELTGEGLAVPLSFEPDAAFIVMTVLNFEGDFTGKDIVKIPGANEAIGGKYPEDRFRLVFSDIRFMLDVLRSTLVQADRRHGMPYVYRRNPGYKIVDRRAE
jgi:hypothetical protein